MAGQAILPAAAFWLWDALQARGKKMMCWGLGGALLAAGMTLTYYRMAFHYLAVVVSILLIRALLRDGLWDRKMWLLLFLLGVLTIIMISPWMSNVAAVHQISPLHTSAKIKSGNFLQQLKEIHVSWDAQTAILILVGILTAFSSGNAIAVLPIVWLWILMLLPLLRLTPLPGVSIIQEFTIYTSLYIPLVLIESNIAKYFVELGLNRKRIGLILFSVTLIIVGICKLPSSLNILDRGYDLSSRPDIRAAAWIRQNLPEDALFLINGIVYTDGYSAVGADAGWWLPILSGRKVIIPPQYALLAERPIEPGYSEAVNQLVQTLSKTNATSSEGLTAICQFPFPITHVYLGQRQGMVAKALPRPPSRPMLSADLLLQHPAFRLIYHQDRVWIFALDREVCEERNP